jgi:hypothetical protein
VHDPLANPFGRTSGIERRSTVSDGIRRRGSTREACSASMTLGFSMPHPVLPRRLCRRPRRRHRRLRPVRHAPHRAGEERRARVPPFVVAANASRQGRPRVGLARAGRSSLCLPERDDELVQSQARTRGWQRSARGRGRSRASAHARRGRDGKDGARFTRTSDAD